MESSISSIFSNVFLSIVLITSSAFSSFVLLESGSSLIIPLRYRKSPVFIFTHVMRHRINPCTEFFCCIEQMRFFHQLGKQVLRENLPLSPWPAPASVEISYHFRRIAIVQQPGNPEFPWIRTVINLSSVISSFFPANSKVYSKYSSISCSFSSLSAICLTARRSL